MLLNRIFISVPKTQLCWFGKAPVVYNPNHRSTFVFNLQHHVSNFELHMAPTHTHNCNNRTNDIGRLSAICVCVFKNGHRVIVTNLRSIYQAFCTIRISRHTVSDFKMKVGNVRNEHDYINIYYSYGKKE